MELPRLWPSTESQTGEHLASEAEAGNEAEAAEGSHDGSPQASVCLD